MTRQLDLGITDPAQRFDLLESLEIAASNSTLLAAILWQFLHLPNCYLSQDRMAKRLKVKNRKTIGRAIDKLQKMGIVAVARYHEPSVGSVVNHYSIVWSEVALLVARQANGTPSCPIATPPTNGTVGRDQRDTCELPMGQLAGTNGTAGCPTREEEKTENKQTTEPVVVSLFEIDTDEWAATEQRLADYPVVAHAKAIAAARSRGWHPSRVDRLIEQAQRQGSDGSHLYQWIVLDSAPPEPKRELVHNLHSLPCQAQIEAGGLMRLAKSENWTHDRLQSAITALEVRWRLELNRTGEHKPCH